MECKRILLGKPFLLLLVALLFISTYFFVYQNTLMGTSLGYEGDVYDELLTEYADLSFKEGLALCKEYQNNASMQMWEGTWDDSIENYIQYDLMRQLQAQYDYLAGYEKYLADIQKNAKRLQTVSLFSDPDSFSYKNVVKTAEDFAALSAESVTMGHDLAVTKVFDDNWTEVISLIPIFLVCGLFLLERRKGLHVLVHATPAGRGKLAAKRVAILLVASAITVLVLYGARILLYGYLYHGLGEWGRTLQSIPMFYNVPYPMTVGAFWGWYLTVKTFGLFFFGLLLWLIQALISNIAVAIGTFGIVAGAEFACTAILSNSYFAILRYVNLFSYINYLPVFSKYLNLHVFGRIVTGNALSCFLLPILCCVFALLVLLVCQGKHPIKGKKRSFRRLERFKAKVNDLCSRGGLFAKELKKLLLFRRGIVVLIVFLALLTQLGVPQREEVPWDMYLTYYREKYAGPITEDTLKSLQAELEVAEESERVTALRQIISEANFLPEGSWIVPSGPYEALFKPQQYHYTIALFSILFLLLLVSPIASQERQAEAVVLLNSTPAGRRRLWLTKHALIWGSAFVVWITVYGSELYRLIDYYGSLTCFQAPLTSIVKVTLYEGNVTIGQTLLLIYALRLAVLLMVAEICFVLSSLCKKNSNAIILNCSVLVIPAAIAAIGSFAGSKLSVLMPLTVIDLAPSLYPYLILLLVFAAAAACARKMSLHRA